MPAARSFLASTINERAVRGGAGDLPATLSSEAAFDVRASAQGEELLKSPPRIEDKVIELSSGSDTNLPRAVGEVAEFGLVLEQGAKVEANPMAEKALAISEEVEHNSLVDLA